MMKGGVIRKADRHEGMMEAGGQRRWSKSSKRWRCVSHFAFSDHCVPCKQTMCEYHTIIMEKTKVKNMSWGCQKCKDIRAKKFAAVAGESLEVPVPPKARSSEGLSAAAVAAKPAKKKASAPRYKPVAHCAGTAGKKKSAPRITTIAWCDNHRVARGKCRQCIGKDYTCRVHALVAKQCASCRVSSKPGTLPKWILQCKATKRLSKKPGEESRQ